MPQFVATALYREIQRLNKVVISFSASASHRKFVHRHCFFGVLKETDFKISRWVRNGSINSESFAKDFVFQLFAKCYIARRKFLTVL